MYPRPVNQGFTLIELLVTLVILGLTAALVAPNLFSWLRSRDAATQRDQLAQAFALQPLVASRRGQPTWIDSADDLDIDLSTLTFDQPVLVQANGYCHEGAMTLTLGDARYQYRVTSPFCRIIMVPTDETS